MLNLKTAINGGEAKKRAQKMERFRKKGRYGKFKSR